jgi:hypothetical protein
LEVSLHNVFISKEQLLIHDQVQKSDTSKPFSTTPSAASSSHEAYREPSYRSHYKYGVCLRKKQALVSTLCDSPDSISVYRRSS